MRIRRKNRTDQGSWTTDPGLPTVLLNSYQFFNGAPLDFVNQAVPLGRPGKAAHGQVYHVCPHCELTFRTEAPGEPPAWRD